MITKFNRNDEVVLLGAWHLNRNREDIHIFEKSMFNYRKLYEGIAEGKSYTELLTSGQMEIPYRELTEAPGLSIDPDYMEARTHALLDQRRAYTDELVKLNESDANVLIEKIQKLQAIIDAKEFKPKAEDLAENFLKEHERRRKEKNARYGFGFKHLDRKLGGINRGQLIVLAARPAEGKSAAALQIGFGVSEQKYKTLFLPLEMTTNETLERLLYQQQIIDNGALKAPTPEEESSVRDFLEELEKAGNFIIYEGLNELAGIRQVIQEERPYLVVIDQLTQVKTEQRAKDIRERYTEITSSLKEIAMSENVAILLLTQLNREATRTGRPDLENLHEADSTGQNADVVLILSKGEERERVGGWFDAEVYIAKNRQGESGVTIKENFIGHEFRFTPVEYGGR